MTNKSIVTARLICLFAVTTMLAALPGCSDPSAEFVGNWKAGDGDLKVQDPGGDWMLDAMMMYIAHETEFKATAELTLASDGTYSLAMNVGMFGVNDRGHGTGTWHVKDGHVVLESDHSDERFRFKYRGGKLILDDDPGATAVLSRS